MVAPAASWPVLLCAVLVLAGVLPVSSQCTEPRLLLLDGVAPTQSAALRTSIERVLSAQAPAQTGHVSVQLGALHFVPEGAPWQHSSPPAFAAVRVAVGAHASPAQCRRIVAALSSLNATLAGMYPTSAASVVVLPPAGWAAPVPSRHRGRVRGATARVSASKASPRQAHPMTARCVRMSWV
jgi:hypothetical protein